MYRRLVIFVANLSQVMAIFLMTFGSASAQLASASKPAVELLAEALLELDELSESYCVRFRGTLSKLQAGNPSLSDFYGISAKSIDPNASYSAWGTFRVVGDRPSKDIEWCEALRAEVNAYRIGDQRATGATVGNLMLSEDELKRQGLKTDYLYPELCPLGAIGLYEHTVQGRKSHFSNLQKMLVEHFELTASETLKNGDVKGMFLGSTKISELEIIFSAKANYLPLKHARHAFGGFFKA